MRWSLVSGESISRNDYIFLFLFLNFQKFPIVGKLQPSHQRALPPFIIPCLSLSHSAPILVVLQAKSNSITEVCMLYNGN